MGEVKKIEGLYSVLVTHSWFCDSSKESFTVTGKFKDPLFDLELKLSNQKTPDANGFIKGRAKYKITIEKIEE